MRAEVVTINSELAKKFLAKNDNWRKVRQSHVKTLSRFMKRGLWEENGQTIVFDSNGCLKDGQHRLLACVDSDEPFTTVVVHGILSDNQIDTNQATRSYAEWLRHHGHKHAKELSAVVKILWSYQELPHSVMPWLHPGARIQYDQEARKMIDTRASYLELDTCLDGLDPSYVRSSINMGRLTTPILRTSIAAALAYLFLQKDDKRAELFFATLQNPIPPASNLDAMKHLWSRLRESLKSPTPLVLDMRVALCIKTWNAWRAGADVRVLRHSRNRRGNFPEIK